MVALLCTGTRLTTGYRYTTLVDATGAVAVTVCSSSSFAFPIAGLIAKVGIHLSIQTSSDRDLQHAPNQVVGIRCRRA